MPLIDMRRGTLEAEREAFVPLDWLGDISPLNDIAAVVVECPPDDRGYEEAAAWLRALIDMAHDAGALFVLDEVVTALRYAPGGAAEYYGLQGQVDLYCFGKTLGNGYPVACLAGRKAIMDELTNGVHFSGTFFGEPLGLAAARATLERAHSDPPWDHLYAVGQYLVAEWNALGLEWQLVGHPTRPVIEPRTKEFKSLRQHLFARGHIVVDCPWYVTTATTTADVDALVSRAVEWAAGERVEHGD
jgi:adenosylmethionine-8-amino-7-oxononanoate aminotransferase